MRKAQVLSGRNGFLLFAFVLAALLVFAACTQPGGNGPVISITTQPADTTVKAGSITGSLSVSAAVTEDAELAYQWYSNTSAGSEGGTIIEDATTASFAIPTALTAGTYYYFCEISATGAASVRSKAAKVTVESGVPVITISAQPADTAVTEGFISESLSVTATVTGGAELAYQWYSNTAASNEGGTIVDGATTASFAIPTALTEGSYYYFCEITAAGAASVRSSAAEVTVAAAGTPAVRIDTQPAQSTEVTEGNITGTLSVTASGINGAEVTGYQWYSNTSASNEGGSKINGETDKNFKIPTDLTPDTYYYFCEITASGGAVTKRSDVATVTVSPVPIITITAHPTANTEVNKGDITESLSVTAAVTEDAVLSYQWYSNTSAGNVGGTIVDNATAASFAIPGDLTEGAYYYFCEVTSTGGAAPKRSNAATVTVKVVPAVVITDHPKASTEVTEGSISGTLSVTANGINGAEVTGYQWYNNTSASNMGGTAIGGETDKNFAIPAALTPGKYYYFCEVTGSGGAESKRSRAAAVTVRTVPVITIDADPVNQTVKAGAITESLSVTATVTENAVLSYQWYSNTSASSEGGTPVGGATAASFAIPDTLTAGKYYYFCEVTSTGGAAPERSNAATVTVSNPDTNFVINVAEIDDPELVGQTAEAAPNTDKTFSAAGSGWTAWQWYVDGDLKTGATSASYTFNEDAGVYDLTVEVTDAGGDTWSGSCRVTVR